MDRLRLTNSRPDKSANARSRSFLVLLIAIAPLLLSVSAGSARSVSATVSADESADPADVELVRESIRLTETAYASVLGARPNRQLSVIVRANEADRVETFGIYNDDVFEIFTGSLAWISRSDLERVKGIFHEYAHFYLDPAPHPKKRPVWLEEGLAELLAWRLLDELDLVDHSEIVAYHAAHVSIWPTGSELCSITPRSISGVDYPLVHLGAAVLLEDRSLAAIVEYRDAMADGVAHDEAFASAFGRTEREHCAHVDRAIEALPPAVSMPNDLFLSETPIEGTFAEFVDTPQTVGPGDLLIVKVRTDASAECVLSLHASRSPDPVLTRHSRADGEGDVFWLVTIRWNAVTESGAWAVTCGEGTDELPLRIFPRQKPSG